MAPLGYAAEFDPFLSLDCAMVEGVGAQSKERKGSNWQHCFRYSLGSIALWTRADGGVQLILSHSPQFFRTRRHFSYFRFFVPDAVDAFKLVISGEPLTDIVTNQVVHNLSVQSCYGCYKAPESRVWEQPDLSPCI